MRSLTNYLVSESLFSENMLQSLLVLIAGAFNKGTNGAENLISDRFGTHTDYSFTVNLDITGAEKINIDDNEIIKCSIGHIIEGVIKAALSGSFTLHYDNDHIASQNFKLVPHTNSKDHFDFEIIDNDGNWGSAKFDIKAVRSEDSANLKKLKNNVSLTDEEKAECDFFLIVEYTLSGNTVHIPAMHIVDKSFAPVKHNVNNPKKRHSHLTNDQLQNAITYVGTKYGVV